MSAVPAQHGDAIAIRIRDVTHRYVRSPRAALDAVSLDIAQGSIFGLLGPNGAGKSTLLGLLSGSLALQQGSITVLGSALTRSAHAIKSTSAIVPQEYAFYDDLSGDENLRFFAGAFDLSSAKSADAIARVARICRLEGLLTQRAGEYSGGLKRRLNLAIGLLNEPRILYLDEPTVGIDAESRQYIIEAIRELRASGVTIVYTSHYMEEVEALCDAIAVIDRGRIALSGSVNDLLSKEGDRTLSVRLVAPAPTLVEPLAAFRATHSGFRDWQLEVPAERVVDVLALFASHGASVSKLAYGVSRLEKVYLQVLESGSDPGVPTR